MARVAKEKTENLPVKKVMFDNLKERIKREDVQRPSLKLCQPVSDDASTVGAGNFFLNKETIIKEPIIQFVDYRHVYMVNAKDKNGKGALLGVFDVAETKAKKTVSWDFSKKGFVHTEYPEAKVSEAFVLLVLLLHEGDWMPCTFTLKATQARVGKAILTNVWNNNGQVFKISSVNMGKYYGVTYEAVPLQNLDADELAVLEQACGAIEEEAKAFSGRQLSYDKEDGQPNNPSPFGTK